DLDKETVDFAPNYDESEIEPVVFPARIPNLLINGSSGIAVGMATNIPPHNLAEVINACIGLIENPELSIEELMQFIPGPDFPTAGIIYGINGILEAYRTGRGRIYVRARAEIIEEENKLKIIITELPYQTNKARLIEKIAELIKDKKIEGISALRDESDKDGVRVVVELKRGEIGEVILNNLFQQTQLQSVFGINIVALVDKQPRILNLKQLIEFFIRHRKEVVTRRCVFELRKSRERIHILEGLAVALNNIDAMIILIKAAKTPQEARTNLFGKIWQPGTIKTLIQDDNTQVSRPEGLSLEFGLIETGYCLSEAQIQAILELRLHRLTGLEQDKILDEFKNILKRIYELLNILNNTSRLMEIIRFELEEVLEKYKDERRTQIVVATADLSIEDLITEEDVLVTLSHTGYIKSQAVSNYSAQKRGGKGKAATQMKEEDFIDKLFIANTHDTILCFTDFGKVYWLKVHQLPQASRNSRGKPIVNLLPLEEKERLNAILPVREFSEDKFVFMATSMGTVKKTALINFSRPRANGIIALNLDAGDHLIDVSITDGQQDVILFSQNGKATRFKEEKVRSMGRTARGVRGIRLDNDKVISLIITQPGGNVLTATANGFGKRTPIDYYPTKGRGGKGVIAIKTSERNGKLVGAVQVEDDDDIVLITNCGTLVRTPVKHISVVSRNTQGVNLIRLAKEGEQLVGLNKILDFGSDEEGNEEETEEETI
ncbi:MAG: DNA gyrase subunit A, partial [Thiomargarita sp.]|nr:DNA gyrase subunit A [Thiomargarita sp.]